MRTRRKAALLLAVWALVATLASRLHQAPVDWERFFPVTQKPQENETWLGGGTQYLFADISETQVHHLRDEGLVDAYYPLRRSDTNLTLLLFSRARQNALLQRLGDVPAAGTATASAALFADFMAAFRRYAAFAVPLLLATGFLFFPVRYWLSLLLELSVYTLLNVALLAFWQVPLDVASMLAGLFLVIYAMTLLNYMHLGEIGKKKLALGIGVSLATTMISALYLASSQFGLIAEFGGHLARGLLVLALFLAARLVGLYHARLPLKRLDALLGSLRRRVAAPGLLALFAAASLGLWLGHGSLRTDLNPFSLFAPEDAPRAQIAAFERRYLPALPFVVTIRLDADTTFEEVRGALKAQRLLEKLASSEGLVPLLTPETLFYTFAKRPLKEADEAAWAQFRLAMELEEGPPLFSSDEKRLYATCLVSLLSPSSRMEALRRAAERLDAKTPDASIALAGRLADFRAMERTFTKEGLGGFAVSFFFILLFFWFYCRTWRILPVIAVSAALPAVLYLALHLLSGSPLTLLSLIAMILYAGLYADSFIHLFVCYARERDACLQAVLRPVAVSNLTMIAALSAMAFSGSLLGRFGLEMALLLSLHLLSVTLLLPWLLVRFVRRCRVAAPAGPKLKNGSA